MPKVSCHKATIDLDPKGPAERQALSYNVLKARICREGSVTRRLDQDDELSIMEDVADASQPKFRTVNWCPTYSPSSAVAGLSNHSLCPCS